MSAASSTSIAKADRYKVLVQWNDTKKDYPIDQCLHQLIEQQVERTPEAIALVFGEQALTYRELNRRANQLAHHLRALGVGPDLLIGVCVERSLEMVIALLGILKAGGAYVPLDPEYPKDRLAFMIQDADAPVLLTQNHLVANLPTHKARAICLDTDWGQMANESLDNPSCITRPDQLAYMIYTSGSTGKPKGAKNHHRGICNRLLWMQDEYRLSSTDTVMQKTPFSFDVSVWEFFWPLLTGARLVVARPGGHRDPAYLVDLIEQQNITVLHFVPSMLQIFVEERGLERCGSLRHVICSGEALPYELQEKFFSRLSADLHNLYGPTEAAVDVTYWKCQRGSDLRIVPIGRPVANTQCYVLDPALQPVPVGEVGELHLGGVQIGHGYHNRPELTAEKFIPDPFRNEPGARLYKTGDLARYLPDGAIEYLGRIDDQVKIRGFRIELGEIESRLRQHGSIGDCAVVAREDHGGQKRLVAYLVPSSKEAISLQELRSFVQQKLPEYMIPAAFVTLDALPLSPNGKLDRKALPVPVQSRPELANTYVPPRVPEETLLADIWSQVLQVQPVGVRDNYFELGGDSIRVIQMLARARHKGLHLTLEQVYKEQTIEKLVPLLRTASIDSSQACRTQPFELVAAADRAKLPEELDDAYPLSALQEGMHFHSDLKPGSAIFHDIFSYKVFAAFDQAKLESALQQLVARHPSLRASYDFVGYSEPLQLIHKQVRVPFTVENLSHLGPDEQHKALVAWFEIEKRRPFLWEEAPLVRFHAQLYGERQFQIVVSIHHMIFDGWSLAAFVTELFQDYFSMLAGARRAVPPLRAHYRDFIALEKHATNSEEHRRFWGAKLANATRSRAPRWPASMCKGGLEQVRGPEIIVPAKVLEGLKQMAQAAGVPLRTVLHAAHMKVMSVVYGTSDVLSGVLTNGRQEELDTEQVVGLFLNSAPFRLQLPGGSWMDLCRQTFEAEQEMIPYRRFPLIEAHKLAGGQTLFEVLFDFVNFHVFRGLEGYRNCRLERGHYFEANDIPLGAYFLLDSTSTELEFHFDYDPDQFPEEQIRELSGYYLNTLVAMVADPTARYESFSPLSEAEKKKLTVEWTRTVREFEGKHLTYGELDQRANQLAHCKSRQSVSKLFEAQAARTPDLVAVGFEDQRLTYRELNERANKLAHRLRRLGVGPDVLVGMCVERSLEMVVGILGILKAGGAYVPLDLAHPKERLAFMLQDSSVNVLLTQEELLKGMPIEGLSEIVCLDSDWNDIARESDANLDGGAEAEHLAYVIYTSGSTGKPKGVLVTHHNVVRLFTATDHWYYFSSADVWTLFHSYAFDFSVWEIWGALLYGGRVVVVPYLVSRSPNAFYELLSREGVTVLNQTPSAFRQLIWAEQNAEKKFPLHLRYVIFGGEALELQSLKPWFELHGDKSPSLVNMYGITETTVHVTYRPITLPDLISGQGSVIGVPIPDLQVHVLGPDMNPLPVGEVGELYVGGEGVARGYLNRQELTAERFIPDPFRPTANARLYKTGDVARRLPNGDLEYLGRCDDQVKIRGFRIELGEIETILNRHPAVRESVVLAQESGMGEKRLIAHVVFKKEASSVSDLRGFLKIQLPEYMVPAVFNCLDTLPLTPNGKVDRRALAHADAIAPKGGVVAGVLPIPSRERPKLFDLYVAPRTPEETFLADIWSEVLEVKPVGVQDNYLELGGDSIRVIQMLARARQKGLHLTLEQVYKEQTIAKLVPLVRPASIDSSRACGTQPFELVAAEDRAKLPEGLDDAYPLTAMQEGMRFHSELKPGSAIFHDSFSYTVRATFDQPKLEGALDRLVARHPSMRASFDFVRYSEPLQLIHKKVRAAFTVENLGHLTPDEQHKALFAWFEIEKRRPLPWEEAPLVRFHAQLHGERQFQFIVSIHHAIFDGWSLAAFVTELFQDYFSMLTGMRHAVPPLGAYYRDFVALEKAATKSEEHRRFWSAKLANPTRSRLPRWPTSMCKGGLEQVRGPEILVPAKVLEGLKQMAQTAGVPLRTVLHAAHLKVMSVECGTSDVLSGMLTNGRQEELDAERVVGLFLNSAPFRMQLPGGSWMDLCRQTFEAEREMIPYRRFPLIEAHKLAGGEPLFEVLFDFVNFHVFRGLERYPGCSLDRGYYFEANDIALGAYFFLDSTSTKLEFHFDYDPDQFPEEQIRQLSGHYLNTLVAMVADPTARYESFSPLSEAEKKKLTVDWNQTDRKLEHDATLHRLIEQRVARSPDAVAVEFEDRHLTYRELNQRANRLAHYLRHLGVGPEVLVGIHVDRSLEMLVGLLGILKAGAAYVPLDPSYPKDRLAFMLRDSRAPVLLTQKRLVESLSADGTRAVCLDSDWDEIARHGEQDPERQSTAENLAYVIYTSGSTGKPKGVEVPNRAVVNFLRSMQREPGLDQRDTLLAVTPLSFDIAGLELFLPLLVGARIVLAGRETAIDGDRLLEKLSACRATTLQATPSTLRLLLEAGWPAGSRLKVLCGGEPLPRELADQLLTRSTSLWNMYGPTETTIWSSTYKVRQGVGSVPIGRPIANTHMYVLDPHLRPVPLGVPGELHIGGAGVARGYLNQPKLTAERFIRDPFVPDPDARLYKTGDLARLLVDGNIEFLGRNDFQVKIRGFRIELGEIEARLTQHLAIREAVVVAREDTPGDKRLVAYYTVAKAAEATASAVHAEELRKHLSSVLPDYMVPAAYVALDALPLTPNGKIDRKALPMPEATAYAARVYEAPSGEIETKLAQIWADVLKVERVGRHDHFFELGGHSLLAIRVVSRVRQALSVELPLRDLFAAPTIAGLAAQIETLGAGPGPARSREIVAL